MVRTRMTLCRMSSRTSSLEIRDQLECFSDSKTSRLASGYLCACRLRLAYSSGETLTRDQRDKGKTAAPDRVEFGNLRQSLSRKLFSVSSKSLVYSALSQDCPRKQWRCLFQNLIEQRRFATGLPSHHQFAGLILVESTFRARRVVQARIQPRRLFIEPSVFNAVRRLHESVRLLRPQPRLDRCRRGCRCLRRA